jgi:transposase
MLLKTILNRCQKFKCFVYSEVKFTDHQGSACIEAWIEPRKNSKAICSGCGTAQPGYDTNLEPRRFEFIPVWGIPVFFLYFMRRVDCKMCGVRTEQVPWGEGKKQLTKVYMQYLANWAQVLPWQEVARRFHTSWEKVFHSVEYVVEWGLKHRSLEGITAVGVDEIAWKKGHKYLTLVYQINNGAVRLLWIGKDRTEKTFHGFFDKLGAEKAKLIEYVCSDMWKAYLKVIKERIPQSVHVLDRYHIVARLNKALDQVRAGEHKQMKQDGFDPILTKARWLLLKRPENLTDNQGAKLKDLLKYNLKSMRAYLLKEEFQLLWTYSSVAWATKFIDRWTTKVMRSKIEPLKKEAKTIRKHKSLILNYFRAKKQLSSGIVEGLNNKAKLTMRKSYRFRTQKAIEIALYHSLGKLPEPPLTHRFY